MRERRNVLFFVSHMSREAFQERETSSTLFYPEVPFLDSPDTPSLSFLEPEREQHYPTTTLGTARLSPIEAVTSSLSETPTMIPSLSESAMTSMTTVIPLFSSLNEGEGPFEAVAQAATGGGLSKTTRSANLPLSEAGRKEHPAVMSFQDRDFVPMSPGTTSLLYEELGGEERERREEKEEE